MRLKKYQQVLIALLLTTQAWQSTATQRQSLASIEMQVEAFVVDYPYSSPYPASVRLSSLDPRLRLNACATPLDIAFSTHSKSYGNTSVTVKCASPVAWKIHLPLRIELFDDVATSTIPLLRGQGLALEHVTMRKRDITDLHQGYFRDQKMLLDLQAKRNLGAGTILSSANLQPRTLVKSGQRVTLVLDLKGLRIKTNGLALQSGRQGQTIKVRNSRSQRIVEGVIAANGQVRVSL